MRPTFEQVKQQHYAPEMLKPGSVVLVGETGLKIDLGCGRAPTPGHIGFDADPDAKADYFCDLNKGIPLGDDCCVSIVAGHFLEHVEDPEFLVYEMWRVCQPGALVKINVPAVSWDSAFAIEHRSFISEHFFTQNRCFKAIFKIERLYYQHSQQVLEIVNKYFPYMDAEDAGLLFTNVRRQLLVEARPIPETKEVPPSESLLPATKATSEAS